LKMDLKCIHLWTNTPTVWSEDEAVQLSSSMNKTRYLLTPKKCTVMWEV